MTQNEVAVAAAPTTPAVAKSPIKKKQPVASKAKKTVTTTHPTTAVMVTAAIKELNEKKGSSLPAIKKYLTANYKVDSVKLAPFIRKFLKTAVLKGVLVQVNGTGAAGHFKLAVDTKKPTVKKVVVATKKKPVAKKPAAGTPKKRKLSGKKPKSIEPAAKKVKKAVVAPKPKAVKPAKSPAKAKKTPATKTRPPKIIKKTQAKKVAPKKK